MKHRIYLFAITFFISLATFSQPNKFLYYFDKDWKGTTERKSIYTGTGIVDNGRIELKCVNNKTKALVFAAYFTDSSLAIMDGSFRSYYENGQLESEGNFLQSKRDGVWKTWDKAGYLIDSSLYKGDKNIMHAVLIYHQDRKIESIKIFDEDDHFVKAIYYDKSGRILGSEEDKVFDKPGTEASFPGGKAAWGRFIKKAIEENIDKLTTAHRSGTCRVRFMVDTDGSVSDAEALTMKGSVLAYTAVNAIKNGPKWIPAMQDGKPVRAFREQPVTFTIIEQ